MKGNLMWDEDQRYRLAFERKLIAKRMPHFSFHDPAGNTIITGWAKTNSLRIYRIEVLLQPDFPCDGPLLFITVPNPLRMRGGSGTINALGTSAEFHVYENDRGCVQICHTRDWDASMTCLGVLLKAHLWLEAYEAHLKGGRPIGAFLLEDRGF